jgi:glycosyltransferase involved in cell wall biosynthesis
MISIIIPTSSPKYLNLTLDSLAVCRNIENCQIVICENPEITESTLELVDRFKKIFKLDIKVVSSAIGANNARNTGISHSRGSVIALLDDDCTVNENWLLEIENVFKNSEVSCVGGKVQLSDETNLTKFQSLLLSKVDLGATLQYRPLVDGEYLVSANLAFSREVYHKVGGFNSNLGYSGRTHFIPNDEVLFIRDCANFGTVCYNNNMVVTHNIQDRKDDPIFFIKRAFGQGYADVLLKREQGITFINKTVKYFANEQNTIDVILEAAKLIGIYHAINKAEPTEETYLKILNTFTIKK